ncbi:MAG: DVUA0089 family protein [Azoarcus sp.]|jgi:hypothetical protein|nr:DVUA0089 family protein [Azoarcus sp.]
MKMKSLSSAVLAAGLFSATAAVQAATLNYSGTFGLLTDTVTVTFAVDSAVDNTGVVLFTNSFAAGNFDPFLAVWDASGYLIGFSGDIDMAGGDWDARIEFKPGFLADGAYSFTVGAWPNNIVGIDDWLATGSPVHINDGFYFSGSSSSLLPGGAGPVWNVTISGVVPEPETWAMLLAGLGVVGAVARRRKQ